MGDYWSVMTGGWFQSDLALPNVYEVMTDGWWTAAGPAAPVIVVMGVVMDLAMMHNMGIV